MRIQLGWGFLLPLITNLEKIVKNIVLKIENPEHRVYVYLNKASHYSGRHDPKLCLHDENFTSAQFFNSTNPKSYAL